MAAGPEISVVPRLRGCQALEAREYEPPFDALPTKEEHEVTRAKSDEVDSGEVVTISLSTEAYALIADRAPN